MEKTAVSIFWFRRDLRLFDNAGLWHALNAGFPTVSVFIFDTEILEKLDDKRDARVQFIHRELEKIKSELRSFGSDLDVRYGNPLEIWKDLLSDYNVKCVSANRDYEPYARQRDKQVFVPGVTRGEDVEHRKQGRRDPVPRLDELAFRQPDRVGDPRTSVGIAGGAIGVEPRDGVGSGHGGDPVRLGEGERLHR